MHTLYSPIFSPLSSAMTTNHLFMSGINDTEHLVTKISTPNYSTEGKCGIIIHVSYVCMHFKHVTYICSIYCKQKK